MFNGCTSLTELDLSNFDTSSVTDMSYMFYSSPKLTTIYADSNWNVGSIFSSNMF